MKEIFLLYLQRGTNFAVVLIQRCDEFRLSFTGKRVKFPIYR